MSSSWLEEWLQELNLMDYHELLVNNKLTSVDSLVKLDKSQLKEYGVTKPGHLNRLHKAILKLNGEDTSTSDLIGTTNTNNPSSSLPPLLTSNGAPPIPTRKGSARRRSPSPNTLSVTEEMLMLTNSTESSSSEQPPLRVPRRSQSLRKASSGIDIPLSKSPSPLPENDLLNSTAESYNNNNSISSPNFDIIHIPSNTTNDSSTKSPKRYENVGIKSGAKLSLPKPPPRISSQVSTDEDTTPPPIIPPLRSKQSDPPMTIPTVASYNEILQGEVWSQTNTPTTYESIADITPPSAVITYETVGESLPPPIGDNLYEVIAPIRPKPNTTAVPTAANIYDRLTPSDNTQADNMSTSVTREPTKVLSFSPPTPPDSLSSPPPVTSLPSFSPPLPPKEPTPPPASSFSPPLPPKEPTPPPVTSLPSFSPPLPPKEPTPPPAFSFSPPLPPKEPTPPPAFSFSPPPPSTDTIPEMSVPNFSPPPPPMEDDSSIEVRPLLSDRQSSIANETDFSPPVEHRPPPKFKPPVPNRKSSLIPDEDAPIISTSPPPPFSPKQEEDSSESPIPPPIPKRATLPPPPPPPITYDDHPDCMMQDPETYSIDTHYREGSSVGSISDDERSGSCTPGSPISPANSSVTIPQLSSGSDSFIGLTPPVNRIHMIQSDYAVITDSDSDASPYGTPTSISLFNTLKDIQSRSYLEPVKEDMLLPETSNTYESIPPVPRPKPRSRPQSTFIEEKKVPIMHTCN